MSKQTYDPTTTDRAGDNTYDHTECRTCGTDIVALAPMKKGRTRMPACRACERRSLNARAIALAVRTGARTTVARSAAAARTREFGW